MNEKHKTASDIKSTSSGEPNQFEKGRSCGQNVTKRLFDLVVLKYENLY